MKKLLVFLYAGGSAAGKTTTTQSFAVGEPVEHKKELPVHTRKGSQTLPVLWTVYDNCVVLGNHKSGSDANKGPGAIRAAFNEVLRLGESDTIIVDGKINSPQWIEMVNDVGEEYDVELVCLYYDISPETLLIRLGKRRGVDPSDIVDGLDLCKKFKGYADRFMYNLKLRALEAYTTIHINDKYTVEDIVCAMDDVVCTFFEECDENSL